MESKAPEIRRAGARDIARITPFLAASGLPTEDLNEVAHLDIWLLEIDGQVVGTIALERYGSEGLLRSMSVAPEYRHRGFAKLLVARLERDAQAEGVNIVVLLTLTAESFFERLGYSITDRAEVGPAVRQSAEFKTLCPASARCMSRRLKGPNVFL